MRRLVVVLGDERDAEDVVQDAYLRAFRSWEHFDGTDVRAWLYTIALRLAFNQVRRRRRWLAILGRTEPAPWTDRSDPDLWDALRKIDGRTRAALLLNVLDGYTHREIAAMFEVPEGRWRAGFRGAGLRSGRSSAPTAEGPSLVPRRPGRAPGLPIRTRHGLAEGRGDARDGRGAPAWATGPGRHRP
jgi:RNA polymerase sigma-70 factor (ECF subfamily)